MNAATESRRARKTWSWAATAALSSALVACGGGGGGVTAPPAAATLGLGDDGAQVAWNGPSTIDVLANDSVSKGTLVLQSVSAPAHGTAAIVANKLVYTPANGYFGTDTLSYTARATEGGGTATASVALTVRAQLQLSGVVSDAPLAGAGVTVRVGAASYAATTDTQGAYQVSISSAQPADVVTVEATGAGAQASVRLASALGDLGSLARQAGVDGAIDSRHAPALNASHVSTAIHALLLEANGGQVPATAARIEALSAALLPRRIVDLATLIKLVADKGVALPSGAADTLALVANPSSSTLLADFMTARTSGGNAAQFTATQAEILSGTAPAGAPALAASGQRSVAYVQGGSLQGNDGLLVAYRGDGTATVTRRQGTGEATWSVADGVISVVMTQPYSVIVSATFNGSTGQVDTVRFETTGYVLSQIAGTPGTGMVLLRETGRRINLSGSTVVSTQAFDPTASLAYLGVDLATARPLQASEFESGARWAGLVTGPFAGDPTLIPINAPAVDIAEFSGTAVTLGRTSGALAWTVVDGWLRLTDTGIDRRYLRVSEDAASGVQTWLAADFVSGVMTRVVEVLVARCEPGLAFTAAAANLRHWQSPYGSAATPLFQDVYSDGTAAFVDGTGAELVTSTWSIGGDGKLTFSTDMSPLPQRVREWTPVRRDVTNLVVLEHYVQPNSFDFWRVAVYTDRGSSGR